MNIRPQHATDFYKTGHIYQYPKHTTLVYSNFTCRGDRHAQYLPDFDHKIVFFGLQGICQWLLQDCWNANFFHQPKDAVLAEYQDRMDRSLGPGAVRIDHIAALHDLGYLPILIKALPEGSLVDVRVPMWTIRNTLPDFFWITNYLETQLSAEQWKIITSATTAFQYRKLLDRFALATGSAPEFVPWQGHDFAARGLSGIHDQAQSAAGHLLGFTGTDTILALDYLADYYDGKWSPIDGGSVAATEHSVMCAGGQETEIETFRRLIMEVYPNGIVSIVSDTWDFWRVMTDYTRTLKDQILSRNGKVVFRPDSGDPAKIVCGDPEAPEGTPQAKGALECLWEVFGGTVNAQGYRVLHEKVGLIYGDSITLSRANAILTAMAHKGFASGNIVFGIGSWTYQGVTRDTFGTAIKATYVEIEGKGYAIFKNPKTDDGLKKSANGLLRVEFENGKYVLYDNQTWEQEAEGLLKPVFWDGKLQRFEKLERIRERLFNGGF